MNKEEVENNLREYWRLAGLKSTGFYGMHGLMKGLAICLMRGPESTRIMTEAAIRDAELRMAYLVIL